MEQANQRPTAPVHATPPEVDRSALNDMFADLGEGKPLRKSLEKLRDGFEDVTLMYDPAARRRAARWTPRQQGASLAKYKLVAEIFSGAGNKQDLLDRIDEATRRLQGIQQRNLKKIGERVKPLERAVRSLELLHENRNGRGKVKLMLTEEGRFARRDDPEVRHELWEYLEAQYGQFKIEESPQYITYFGELSDRETLLELAKMGMKTRALAILDVPPMADIADVKAEAAALSLVGVSEERAYLVVPATQVTVESVNSTDGEPLPVPAGPIVAGRLLGREPGTDVTGLNHPMDGISGVIVKYKVERKDAFDLANLGLVMIGTKGEILGTRTANQSSNPDLAQFIKVDVKNTIDKALVQFANTVVLQRMTPSDRETFRRTIVAYLNQLAQKGEIESFTVDIPKPLKGTDVIVNLSIKFTDVPETVTFHYQGAPGEVQKM